MNKPELIFYNGFKLNEAMHWDRKNGLLYFVSIRNNLIYSLHPKTGRIVSYVTEGAVGGAVTDCDGNIIEAEKSGIYRICPVSGEKTFLTQILPCATMRYNHLILDSRGRILVDVMGDEKRHAGEGGLYQLEGDTARCLISGTTVANGIALSDDETKLYFTDTPTKTVQEYSYDIETGSISDRRDIIVMDAAEPGLPDGLMLGKCGDIWIAEWASGRLSRWRIRDGKKLDEILFPSAHVTSTCFGGENNEYMYVATAKAREEEDAPAGGIFRLKIEE